MKLKRQYEKRVRVSIHELKRNDNGRDEIVDSISFQVFESTAKEVAKVILEAIEYLSTLEKQK